MTRKVYYVSDRTGITVETLGRSLLTQFPEAEFEIVPDAYQTLLFDVMIGDQTLFVRGDEVEESWRLYTPLLAGDIQVHPYPAGTWGPADTNEELALWTNEWTMRR